jgi:hypothetical protein
VALPPLATVADLRTALLGASDPVSDDAAALALRRASARVRRHTGQALTFIQGDTRVVMGGGRTLLLPQRPAVVTSAYPLTVAELDTPGGGERTLAEGVDFSRLGSELTRSFTGAGGVWAARVRVTYSHGYAEIPDDIVDVVLDLASTNLINPGGVRSETVGGESVTYATETVGNAALTDQHRADLRPYTRGAFSVTLS